MDRCALFVDAGYVLADGAMAVHGTRRRESVSWDYAGLLQFLSGLARERSGLPLLRCYWYEATVEGRRSAEHDTLADLPGVKLRLAKRRPGHREGVEGEIHRDLTALARNKAVSDAMVVSAEEDLAQVVADVQDLGMRVSLLHIGVDGDWTVSRALRQECDDIVEISSAHLRPYVELISGAEPPRPDERDGAPLVALRPVDGPAVNGPAVNGPAVNGQGHPGDTVSYPPALDETGSARQASAQIRRVPTPVRDYQHPAQPQPQPEEPAAAETDFLAALARKPAGVPPRAVEQPVRSDLPPAGQEAHQVQRDAGAEQDQGAASPGPAMTPAADYFAPQPEFSPIQPEQAPAQQEYAAPEWGGGRDLSTRRDVYGAPAAVPAPPYEQSAGLPAARGRAAADLSGYNPGAMREQQTLDETAREPLSRESGEPQPVPAAQASTQVRRLPTRGAGEPGAGSGPEAAGMQPAGQPAAAPHLLSAPTAAPPAAQPMPAQSALLQPGPEQPWAGQPGMGQSGIGQPGIGQPEIGQSGTGQPEAGPLPVPQPEFGQPPAAQPSAGQHGGAGQHGAGQQSAGQQSAAQYGAGQHGAGQPAGPAAPMTSGSGYAAGRNGSYTGPRPVFTAGPGGNPPAAPSGYGGAGGPAGQSPGPSGSGLVTQPAAPGQPGSGFGVPGLPTSAGSPAGALNGTGQPPAYSPAAGAPGALSVPGAPGGGGSPSGLPGPLGPAGPMYSAAQPGVSLADAVQSAHREGQEFGESVARDAPALWLEAVLARKPRMPSDLEARLLQGSALPIDFLLHDEVRHALRRGFWDALERARR